MGSNVGILGLGAYLPAEVRRNDWWAPEVVARWATEARASGPPPAVEARTDGMRRVLAALAEQGRDPFQCAVERRVLAPELGVLDMEEAAARAAIADAGLDAGAIDLLLTCTIVPDQLVSNTACTLHRRLGLRHECFSMPADTSSNAFAMQLAIAEAMIAAGRARYALIVQSCVPSRLIDLESPIAPLFGDAATAAIVGRVSSGRGIEASVSFTDGEFPQTLVLSVPGSTWYASGRPVLNVADPAQSLAVFLHTADDLKESVDTALARAGRTHAEVDFFCIHQGAPWLRRVVQEHAHLTSARSVEAFARTGYVFASTLPLSLIFARQEGQLHDGDLVVLAAGGPGVTYGATILRWGA